MTFPQPPSDNVLQIYLTLSQYPILSGRIRSRMRRELFTRGIISKADFEDEARNKAMASQIREGVHEPLIEENAEVWETRLRRVRDSLTDFLFAYNFPYSDFETLVRQVLTEHGQAETDFVWFNPELAPQNMLFEQAELIASMPPEERQKHEARLQEIKVVLIRTMISDQLRYINIARRWFEVEDLKEIRQRKIGGGKVGGKAAGMLLAMRILKATAPPEVRDCFRTPVSYYLGSDAFYNFMSLNGLMHWNDQKYKSEEEMRADYPKICAEFSQGNFPPEVLERLEQVVRQADKSPLIVRSSSLLEDNFGTSFAGKYESVFCPNQGTPEENLLALTKAIARVYASALHPDALLYRHHKGLTDYDERIAILIQFVEGEAMGRYYFPEAAGVAFSRNLYRWSPQIKQEDGFLRLVWGLGTRAVEMVAEDHPRLVALSHPRLYPSSDARSIRRYSQRNIDVIDLQANQFCTIPVREVITPRYPPIRYIMEVEWDGDLSPMVTNQVEPEKLFVTFDGLLGHTPFPARIREALQLLEKHYGSPVDVEFTAQVVEPDSQHPGIRITLLQCRPQSHIQDTVEASIPKNIKPQDFIFSSQRMVPQGAVLNIRYVLFVPPEGYFHLSTDVERIKLQHSIGKLNAALKDEIFIAVGPGRWGSSTPDLGVHVAYGDIYNTRALIELSDETGSTLPEPSFGTHFFQDLMEARIYPLAVFLNDKDTAFNREFFYSTPNRLLDFVNADPSIQQALRLIDVRDYRPRHVLDLVMDAQRNRAAAYLAREELPAAPEKEQKETNSESAHHE